MISLFQCEKKRFFIKAIAIVVIVTFSTTQLGWADGISRIRAEALPDSGAAGASAGSPLNFIDRIELPSDIADVRKVFRGEGDRVVIHIQDAHANYEAQKNIAAILNYFVTNHGVTLANVEGTSGEIDTSILASFPDPEIRRSVSDYFLRQAKITGPEFYAVSNAGSLVLNGIERGDLYEENRKVFVEALSYANEDERMLKALREVFEEIGRYLFSRDMKALYKLRKRFEEDPQYLPHYAEALLKKARERGVPIENCRHLESFERLRDLEGKIDFEAAEKEVPLLAEEIKKRLSKDGRELFAANTVAYRKHKMSRAQYYGYLEGEVARLGVSRERYQNVLDYLEYGRLYDSIGVDLFGELEALETALKEKLLSDGDEKRLDELLGYLRILERLFSFSLTKEDAEFFYANRAGFASKVFVSFVGEITRKNHYRLLNALPADLSRVDRDVERIQKFYECAIRRDDVIIANALEKMNDARQPVSVMVTGGFHTAGIERALEERKISYLVVAPKVLKAADEEEERRLYQDSIVQKPTAIEQYLIRNYLAAKPAALHDPRYQLAARSLLPLVGIDYEGASRSDLVFTASVAALFKAVAFLTRGESGEAVEKPWEDSLRDFLKRQGREDRAEDAVRLLSVVVNSVIGRESVFKQPEAFKSSVYLIRGEPVPGSDRSLVMAVSQEEISQKAEWSVGLRTPEGGVEQLGEAAHFSVPGIGEVYIQVYGVSGERAAALFGERPGILPGIPAKPEAEAVREIRGPSFAGPLSVIDGRFQDPELNDILTALQARYGDRFAPESRGAEYLAASVLAFAVSKSLTQVGEARQAFSSKAARPLRGLVDALNRYRSNPRAQAFREGVATETESAVRHLYELFPQPEESPDGFDGFKSALIEMAGGYLEREKSPLLAQAFSIYVNGASLGETAEVAVPAVTPEVPVGKTLLQTRKPVRSEPVAIGEGLRPGILSALEALQDSSAPVSVRSVASQFGETALDDGRIRAYSRMGVLAHLSESAEAEGVRIAFDESILNSPEGIELAVFHLALHDASRKAHLARDALPGDLSDSQRDFLEEVWIVSKELGYLAENFSPEIIERYLAYLKDTRQINHSIFLKMFAEYRGAETPEARIRAVAKFVKMAAKRDQLFPGLSVDLRTTKDRNFVVEGVRSLEEAFAGVEAVLTPGEAETKITPAPEPAPTAAGRRIGSIWAIVTGVFVLGAILFAILFTHFTLSKGDIAVSWAGGAPAAAAMTWDAAAQQWPEWASERGMREIGIPGLVREVVPEEVIPGAQLAPEPGEPILPLPGNSPNDMDHQGPVPGTPGFPALPAAKKFDLGEELAGQGVELEPAKEGPPLMPEPALTSSPAAGEGEPVAAGPVTMPAAGPEVGTPVISVPSPEFSLILASAATTDFETIVSVLAGGERESDQARIAALYGLLGHLSQPGFISNDDGSVERVLPYVVRMAEDPRNPGVADIASQVLAGIGSLYPESIRSFCFVDKTARQYGYELYAGTGEGQSLPIGKVVVDVDSDEVSLVSVDGREIGDFPIGSEAAASKAGRAVETLFTDGLEQYGLDFDLPSSMVPDSLTDSVTDLQVHVRNLVSDQGWDGKSQTKFPKGVTPAQYFGDPTPVLSDGEDFGWRIHPVQGYRKFHYGNDITAKYIPLYSPANGIVERITSGGGGGTTIWIRHPDVGLTEVSMHLSKTLLSPGDRVIANKTVYAVSGNSGTLTTGAHLHYGMMRNGEWVDPEEWFYQLLEVWPESSADSPQHVTGVRLYRAGLGNAFARSMDTKNLVDLAGEAFRSPGLDRFLKGDLLGLMSDAQDWLQGSVQPSTPASRQDSMTNLSGLLQKMGASRGISDFAASGWGVRVGASPGGILTVKASSLGSDAGSAAGEVKTPAPVKVPKKTLARNLLIIGIVLGIVAGLFLLAHSGLLAAGWSHVATFWAHSAAPKFLRLWNTFKWATIFGISIKLFGSWWQNRLDAVAKGEPVRFGGFIKFWDRYVTGKDQLALRGEHLQKLEGAGVGVRNKAVRRVTPLSSAQELVDRIAAQWFVPLPMLPEITTDQVYDGLEAVSEAMLGGKIDLRHLTAEKQRDPRILDLVRKAASAMRVPELEGETVGELVSSLRAKMNEQIRQANARRKEENEKKKPVVVRMLSDNLGVDLSAITPEMNRDRKLIAQLRFIHDQMHGRNRASFEQISAQLRHLSHEMPAAQMPERQTVGSRLKQMGEKIGRTFGLDKLAKKKMPVTGNVLRQGYASVYNFVLTAVFYLFQLIRGVFYTAPEKGYEVLDSFYFKFFSPLEYEWLKSGHNFIAPEDAMRSLETAARLANQMTEREVARYGNGLRWFLETLVRKLVFPAAIMNFLYRRIHLGILSAVSGAAVIAYIPMEILKFNFWTALAHFHIGTAAAGTSGATTAAASVVGAGPWTMWLLVGILAVSVLAIAVSASSGAPGASVTQVASQMGERAVAPEGKKELNPALATLFRVSAVLFILHSIGALKAIAVLIATVIPLMPPFTVSALLGAVVLAFGLAAPAALRLYSKYYAEQSLDRRFLLQRKIETPAIQAMPGAQVPEAEEPAVEPQAEGVSAEQRAEQQVEGVGRVLMERITEPEEMEVPEVAPEGEKPEPEPEPEPQMVDYGLSFVWSQDAQHGLQTYHTRQGMKQIRRLGLREYLALYRKTLVEKYLTDEMRAELEEIRKIQESDPEGAAARLEALDLKMRELVQQDEEAKAKALELRKLFRDGVFQFRDRLEAEEAHMGLSQFEAFVGAPSEADKRAKFWSLEAPSVRRVKMFWASYLRAMLHMAKVYTVGFLAEIVAFFFRKEDSTLNKIDRKILAGYYTSIFGLLIVGTEIYMVVKAAGFVDSLLHTDHLQLFREEKGFVKPLIETIEGQHEAGKPPEQQFVGAIGSGHELLSLFGELTGVPIEDVAFVLFDRGRYADKSLSQIRAELAHEVTKEQAEIYRGLLEGGDREIAASLYDRGMEFFRKIFGRAAETPAQGEDLLARTERQGGILVASSDTDLDMQLLAEHQAGEGRVREAGEMPVMRAGVVEVPQVVVDLTARTKGLVEEGTQRLQETILRDVVPVLNPGLYQYYANAQFRDQHRSIQTTLQERLEGAKTVEEKQQACQDAAHALQGIRGLAAQAAPNPEDGAKAVASLDSNIREFGTVLPALFGIQADINRGPAPAKEGEAVSSEGRAQFYRDQAERLGQLQSESGEVSTGVQRSIQETRTFSDSMARWTADVQVGLERQLAEAGTDHEKRGQAYAAAATRARGVIEGLDEHSNLRESFQGNANELQVISEVERTIGTGLKPGTPEAYRETAAQLRALAEREGVADATRASIRGTADELEGNARDFEAQTRQTRQAQGAESDRADRARREWERIISESRASSQTNLEGTPDAAKYGFMRTYVARIVGVEDSGSGATTINMWMNAYYIPMYESAKVAGKSPEERQANMEKYLQAFLDGAQSLTGRLEDERYQLPFLEDFKPAERPAGEAPAAAPAREVSDRADLIRLMGLERGNLGTGFERLGEALRAIPELETAVPEAPAGEAPKEKAPAAEGEEVPPAEVAPVRAGEIPGDALRDCRDALEDARALLAEVESFDLIGGDTEGFSAKLQDFRGRLATLKHRLAAYDSQEFPNAQKACRAVEALLATMDELSSLIRKVERAPEEAPAAPPAAEEELRVREPAGLQSMTLNGVEVKAAETSEGLVFYVLGAEIRVKDLDQGSSTLVWRDQTEVLTKGDGVSFTINGTRVTFVKGQQGFLVVRIGEKSTSQGNEAVFVSAQVLYDMTIANLFLNQAYSDAKLRRELADVQRRLARPQFRAYLWFTYDPFTQDQFIQNLGRELGVIPNQSLSSRFINAFASTVAGGTVRELGNYFTEMITPEPEPVRRQEPSRAPPLPEGTLPPGAPQPGIPPAPGAALRSPSPASGAETKEVKPAESRPAETLPPDVEPTMPAQEALAAIQHSTSARELSAFRHHPDQQVRVEALHRARDLTESKKLPADEMAEVDRILREIPEIGSSQEVNDSGYRKHYNPVVRDAADRRHRELREQEGLRGAIPGAPIPPAPPTLPEAVAGAPLVADAGGAKVPGTSPTVIVEVAQDVEAAIAALGPVDRVEVTSALEAIRAADFVTDLKPYLEHRIQIVRDAAEARKDYLSQSRLLGGDPKEISAALVAIEGMETSDEVKFSGYYDHLNPIIRDSARYRYLVLRGQERAARGEPAPQDEALDLSQLRLRLAMSERLPGSEADEEALPERLTLQAPAVQLAPDLTHEVPAVQGPASSTLSPSSPVLPTAPAAVPGTNRQRREDEELEHLLDGEGALPDTRLMHPEGIDGQLRAVREMEDREQLEIMAKDQSLNPEIRNAARTRLKELDKPGRATVARRETRGDEQGPLTVEGLADLDWDGIEEALQSGERVYFDKSRADYAELLFGCVLVGSMDNAKRNISEAEWGAYERFTEMAEKNGWFMLGVRHRPAF
ncbi:MAG TPA: peptidoglycan DD-metalloendopeptidase family protein, partial [Candidatus Omnitrophota bacterium]|nr:peptidoglycan DD-metalloendopeptidase family protein [Candidatus Omnitrophota bacterium]